MNSLRIFIDGACQPNPGSMGIGVVVEWQGIAPLIISEYGGEGTNNIAEYKALNRALEAAKRFEIKSFELQCDSMLVVCQMKKVHPKLNSTPKIIGWKCNEKELQELRDLALRRIKYLEELGSSIKLEYIPRELNLADLPAKNGTKKEKS
jgi:ribonuclease HI